MAKKLDSFVRLLSGVDDTYRRLPLNMRLQVEKISQGLTEFGPRKLQRRGAGTEFFESRDFRPDVDEPRKINARLSGRAGKPVVVEKEAEIRQHFYLWRDPSPSMEFNSAAANYTKREAAEIMLLAFAKHLARNEELIGILDRRGTYRGGKASDSLTNHLLDVNIVTGNEMPSPARRLPQNSTAVLFSDFLMDHDTLLKGLSELNGTGLKGYLVMTLDPQEIDFKYKGHVEFDGLEGEGKERFKKAESMKAAYQEKMREHIDGIEKICKAKGFKLILQRTDEPLHNALLSIYGLRPSTPARGFAPKP
jgi:uncharacterized protein (DUF58 family)